MRAIAGSWWAGALAALALFAEADGALVIHAKIEGIIDGGVAAYVERVVDDAESDTAVAIIFEMDTYGGRVDAADEIRQSLLNTDLFTVTWIHSNAASAGALIAIATDTIAMAPGAAIGAATPVSGQTGQVASNKVVSYFRTIMGETARATGRDPRIAEAMVDSSVVVSGLEDAPRPLTLRTDQAISYGIAQQEARTFDEVLRLNDLEGAEIKLLEPDIAEDIVRFLTHPTISGLLMTIGALGLIYELTSPGFGLAGTAGLVCLMLFFGSHWIIKLAQWPELVMFIVGFVLIIAEFFVPGGILGIVGGLVVLGSLLLSMLPKIDFITTERLASAFTTLGASVIITFIGAVILLRSFIELPIFQRLLLSTRQDPGKGVTPKEMPRESLVGKEGIAETMLRPSGRARIDGHAYDVATSGEVVERGAPVKVISADGMQVTVREA